MPSDAPAAIDPVKIAKDAATAAVAEMARTAAASKKADEDAAAAAAAEAAKTAGGGESGGRSRTDQTVADLRAEAAQWRVSFRQAEAKLTEANEKLAAAQAEVETAKAAAVAPAQARLEKAIKRVSAASIESAMVAAGLVDRDLIVLSEKMPNAPKVAVDDEFNVTGVDELVVAFKKWKPEYFKTPESGGSGKNGRTPAQRDARDTSGGREPPSSDRPPTTDVRAMNPAEYRAFKDKLLRDMRTTTR